MKNLKALFTACVLIQSLAVLCLASPKRASMVQIIANPEHFSDTLVSIDGCVSVGFERNAIFLSRFDLEYYITPNSFRLVFKDDEFTKYRHFDGKVCRISGKFNLVDERGVLSVEAITELGKTEIRRQRLK